jgi:hypothetical protein
MKYKFTLFIRIKNMLKIWYVLIGNTDFYMRFCIIHLKNGRDHISNIIKI